MKDANEVYEHLDGYLKERGLTLAPDKTKITHIDDGIDFLGYNVRCYKGHDRDRVLVKASKDSVKSFKSKGIQLILFKNLPKLFSVLFLISKNNSKLNVNILF